MIVVFIILSALAVVAIGLVAVGRLAGQLAEQPRPALYDRAEAVDFVADRLPDDVTAQLTYTNSRNSCNGISTISKNWVWREPRASRTLPVGHLSLLKMMHWRS